MCKRILSWFRLDYVDVKLNFIEIVGVDLCVYPDMKNNHIYDKQTKGRHIGLPLHEMIQWFKTMTTNEYIRGVRKYNWQPFNKKMWQKNYWEHIIRNEESYVKLSEYIKTNPQKWEIDTLHPNKEKTDE